jgi:hypothetical protein
MQNDTLVAVDIAKEVFEVGLSQQARNTAAGVQVPDTRPYEA